MSIETHEYTFNQIMLRLQILARKSGSTQQLDLDQRELGSILSDIGTFIARCDTSYVRRLQAAIASVRERVPFRASPQAALSEQTACSYLDGAMWAMDVLLQAQTASRMAASADFM